MQRLLSYCLVILAVLGKLTYSIDQTFVDRPKAIVIGATSGMGRQVAKLLAHDYNVGIAGRRLELLQSLQTEIQTTTYVQQLDVTADDAELTLTQLIETMGGLDLMVISISSYIDTLFVGGRESDRKILDVDLVGFWRMADIAVSHFEQQKSGHLVGISSIDGLRGSAHVPVYSGAKAFIGCYLEGVRNRMIQKNIPISVTEIIPGWVNNETTDFTKVPGTYWVATTEKAAEQIYDAIKAKKKRAYITKRWAIIGGLLAILPDWLYNAIGGI